MGGPARSRSVRTLERSVAGLALLVVPQVIAVHVVLQLGGGPVHPKAILNTLRQILPTLLLILIAGVAARAVYEAWRGRLRAFVRAITRPPWLIASAALLLCGALTVHAYSYLKLMIPLVHQASFDQTFWNLDRSLLLGRSPSVFLLTLFSDPRLLRAIDWSYARLYYPVLLGFIGFMLSLRSNRLRFAIASGFAGMWLAGAWLYLALPSLGPCYAVSQVWEQAREVMTVSHRTQVLLMDNYVKVLKLREGLFSGLNPSLGIAAFPSLHVGSQLYAALWMRRLAPWLGFVLLLTVGVLFVGSIVTGWHYMIDSLAGLAMAWLAYRLSTRAWGLEGWRRCGAARS